MREIKSLNFRVEKPHLATYQNKCKEVKKNKQRCIDNKLSFWNIFAISYSAPDVKTPINVILKNLLTCL